MAGWRRYRRKAPARSSSATPITPPNSLRRKAFVRLICWIPELLTSSSRNIPMPPTSRSSSRGDCRAPSPPRCMRCARSRPPSGWPPGCSATATSVCPDSSRADAESHRISCFGAILCLLASRWRPARASHPRTQQSGKMGGMDTGASSPRVLVVDDDSDVLASLERGLRLSGFEVSTAVDGAEALRSATETRPDAIVLDINMPVLDGVSVVTALRAMDNDVPVCVLSARSSVDDRVAPLEVGIPGRRARVNGADVDLTKREFDLLAVLAEHKTAVLSRAQLLELVWGYDFAADTNVVDVFIGYLRRKLEAGGAPRLLHTVRGVGFVLRTQ